MWWGNPEENYRSATLEGGGVLPIGSGYVLIGMSERTSRQAITQLAAALFAKNAAKRVIIAGMPKLRAAMHLDTVFTFCEAHLSALQTFFRCFGDPKAKTLIGMTPLIADSFWTGFQPHVIWGLERVSSTSRRLHAQVARRVKRS